MRRAARSRVWVLVMLWTALALAACGRQQAPPAPVDATEAVDPKAFALLRAGTESYEGRPAAILTFSQPLAGAQKFDELAGITGKDGSAVKGSWSLADDGKRLRFPYLDANQTYTITVETELAAADGRTLGKPLARELYTGPLEPLLGFASQGSVLPAHERRGLPIVTVNVGEVDVEFLRVRDASLPKFLAEYQRNGRRSYWSLDELASYADSVYANRFALDSEPNQRTLTYLPVRDIDELRAPGLYFAVMRRPAQYSSEFDTAMFFVSDIGLHLRAYPGHVVVHTTSLETGQPRGAVALAIRDADGNVVLSAETDGDGLARLDYVPNEAHVLSASFGRDVSLLPFNQPALDLSEFAIAGRPQRDAEIFPWSGRDLYRPGETLRVSALLRDFDGRALPAAQPLFATLRQPDGRVVVQQQLAAGELGYFEFSREIALDAPTGRWSVDFSTDPAKSDSAFAFAFRVEEFLPERLKLDLASTAERLKPGEPLPLQVEAAYLYGAPASGNRFTAKLMAGTDSHPVEALKDFHFGDPLAELPKDPADVIDAELDDEGRLQQDIAVLKDTPITGPVAVVLSGSVYETGGRAVSRTLKRTIWPADTLVGVRPLFALEDGAPPEGNAGFEVVRTDAAGQLLAATGLEVKLIREHRDYHWNWLDDGGWSVDYTRRFETVQEQDLTITAGARGQLAWPVEWGGYRVEIFDPETQLTVKLPFEAGWGFDDDNRGTEARPDKVKIALDRTGYRGGETLQATITPPHAGRALLVLESDRLLWHRTMPIQAGGVVEIPLQPEWERHDLYLTALVFRPGSSSERITPNRAVGIAHVPIARDDRRVGVTLTAPETMRPSRPMQIDVAAPNLAGRTAQVRVTAVDLGVLNITRFALPDAAAWFFAQRRLGVEARDLYGRVIESLDGDRARLRFGGDMALLALPAARRPNAEIRTVDLFHAPVALDAEGKATLQIPVPDFNGTLRVRALVYGEDRYGAAEYDSIVRAPVVVEASTPRALSPGDRSKLTLDVQNLSGAAGEYAIELEARGPIALERRADEVALADQAKRTFDYPLTARESFGVAEIVARVTGTDVNIERSFRFVVRPIHPAVARSVAIVQETPAPVAPDATLRAGLYPDSVVARLSVGTLPPLPFAASVDELFKYPFGCVEQTTSKAFPLVWLDDDSAGRLGIALPDAATRAQQLDTAFARLSAMQTEDGHFAMWPGSDYGNTLMTPYVAEFLVTARDAGYAPPEAVLGKALERINADLLSGGNTHYEYDQYEHLRIGEMAHGAYALARVQRAPLGTVRALFDNERGKLVAPLPLAHLGAAFALLGDAPRATAAFEEAFGKEWKRPDWLGDYGSEVRDLALMVALTHEAKLARPEWDARVVDLARELLGRGGAEANTYLSTQDRGAIARLGRTLANAAPRHFAATVQLGGVREELTGRAHVTRTLDPALIAAGARIEPAGQGPLYVVQDVAGVPRSVEPTQRDDLRITRALFRTDGTAYDGKPLAEGEVLVAHLKIESAQEMADALVVDLLPGGLEVENLNLTDASQWDEVTIDGVALSDRGSSADIKYEEYRDDRYVAAIKLYGGSEAHLFYLARAVSPGRYAVPPPTFEDMYRPALRAVGAPVPATIEVRSPQ